MKGVDLNRFPFDYDLTFTAFMMDSEGRIYSRFGSRDAKSATDRMSIAGLKHAMRQVLELYRSGATDAAVAPALSEPHTIEDIPVFKGSPAAKQECYHCHFASNF